MSFFKYAKLCSFVTLLLITGCSGSSDTSSTSSTSTIDSSQASAPSVSAPPEMSGTYSGTETDMSDGGMMESYPGMESAGPGPAGNSKPQIAKRQAIPRPDDPSDWSTRQITAAIEERDLKVIDALAVYADQNQGIDQSAQTVIDWLQLLNQPAVVLMAPSNRGAGAPNSGYPVPGSEGYPTPDDAGASLNVPNSGSEPFDPAAGPGGGPAGYDGAPMAEDDPAGYDSSMMEEGMMPGVPGGGRRNAGSVATDEQIASALIDTLLALHSLTSYQAARDVLQGNLELPFPPEKTAAWTMTSLIKHIEGPHDPAGKILKQSIKQPDLVRSGSGDFDSSRLQEVALQNHWTSALSVVDGLMGLKSSGLSQAKKRQNMNGYEGGEMYDGAPEGDALSATIPGEPGAYPGGAPGGVPNNRPGNDKTNEVNPIPADLTLADFTQEEALAASQYLWSDQLVAEVTERLTESETLMKDPSLLLLAGQLPVTSTRYAFQNFLKKNWLMNEDWTRNPSSFVQYDIFSNYLRDPGLIITLKELPREQQANANANGGEAGYDGAGLQPNNNRQNQDPEKLREERVKNLWFETSQKFTLGLMDRMLSAANAGQLAEYNLDELDIKLHRNASVTLSSRLELALGPPSADPEQDRRDKTVVNYVRIESSELGLKEVNYYKSALRKEAEFIIMNKNGRWLSAPVEKDRRTGELVSVDVLLSLNNARPSIQRRNQQPQQGFNDIAAPPGGNYGEGGGNQTFVIEILTVRIPNPETFLAEPEQAVSAK